MPVPGRCLKREMLGLGEVSFHHAEPDNSQHDRANSHVHTVEACEHVKRGSVYA